MTKLLFFILTFWPGLVLLAQIEPVQNDLELIKKLRVRTVSSYYYNSTDTLGKEKQLVLSMKFDTDGKILLKTKISLWEAVSYRNSTTYKYDENGHLADESTIQMILNLNERDQEYIDAYGEIPLNEKIRYAYNSSEKLIQKEIFAFSTDELPPSAEPSQKITYDYESELLRVEKSSSPQSRVFNQNFTIDFEYDSLNNLIRRTRTYGLEMDKKQIAEYSYNLENQMVEEKIIDSAIPRNNIHLRYDYNEAGRLQNEFVFDVEEDDFVVEISYTYDTHGNKISGEKDVSFTYDENDLIRSEFWKDDLTDEVVYFVSEYEFH